MAEAEAMEMEDEENRENTNVKDVCNWMLINDTCTVILAQHLTQMIE